jgi:signal transduction histidine kinase
LNIQERARLVGGTVEIRSSPGQGTSVTVEVPE